MAEHDDLFNAFMELDSYDSRPREDYIRAPFGWPGGKKNSLKHIIPKLPAGKTFVEGCGGSGIVTINSPDWYKQKVFNDRHAGIVAFYRCLRSTDKMDALLKRLRLTVHSREEFLWCRDSWTNCQDDVERAARWYYMLRVSFGQLGRNFGRSTNTTNMIAKKLRNGLNLFPVIHERFQDVLVENLDVLQIIRDYDNPETVFYIDPPYQDTNPIYQHNVEHQGLMDAIQRGQGWFAVSGYANKLYDSCDWDERHDWEVMVALQSQAFNEESHLQDKRDVMTRDKKVTEVLWVKYPR